jgi:6-phosphogluconolactonase
LASPKIVVLDTPQLLAARAADEFESACAKAVAQRGRFAVALSGGKTPRAMLVQLARRPFDWIRVHFFWSDERCVAPDDPNSNYGMARSALLEPARIPESNVHRMKGELDPPTGAQEYTEQLRVFFGGEPIFDMVHLGLGPDGHTASLFPGSAALHVTDRPCVATRVDGSVPSGWRLTLTYPAINAGRRVLFLVEGPEKASILKRVIEGPQDVERYPAQGIAPHSGDLMWLVDAAAAFSLGAK